MEFTFNPSIDAGDGRKIMNPGAEVLTPLGAWLALDQSPGIVDPKLIALLKMTAPDWEPMELLAVARMLILDAGVASLGECAGILAYEPKLGWILNSLDFDGEGGVLVNRQTVMHEHGRQLTRVLRLLLGRSCRIGEWRRCGVYVVRLTKRGGELLHYDADSTGRGHV